MPNDRQPDNQPARLSRLRQALVSTLKDYVVTVRWKGEEEGLAAVQNLIHTGPLHWPGLLVLVVSVIATAYLSWPGHGLPIVAAEIWEGEVVQVPLPALYLSLAVMSFGWAYVLVGAAAFGLGAYVLVAAYASFYGLFPALGQGGTLWFILIPIWLLILGGWVASAHPTRWRLPLLFLLCLIASLLTYPALNVQAILRGTWGRLAVAGVYFALVANPRAMKKRPFKPVFAFVLSVIVFICLYGVSLQRSAAGEVLGYTFLSAHYLLGLVSLFWLWIGLDLFRGAQDLAGWLARALRGIVPSRVIGITVFTLWTLWSTMAYLLAHGPSLGLTQFLWSSGWGRGLLQAYLSLTPSPALVFALEYHFYLTVAIALVATALWLTKRASPDALIRLLSLSVFTFLVLYGFLGVWFALGSEDWQAILGFWPLLIFVAGMFWEIIKSAADLLSGAKTQMVSLFLGLVLLFAGISLLELAAQYPYFAKELSLNPFLGIFYLGLPYLLFVFLQQQGFVTSASSRMLVLLFALGMLSAMPSLAWGRILIAPLVWLVAILATVWRSERWNQVWDGLIYTGGLALGFVVFYTHPVIIPIPAFTGFLGRFVELQARYADNVIWPWELRWWCICVAAVAAGLTLGYSLSRARQAPQRRRGAWLALGLAASIALMAACEWVLLGAR